MPPFVLTLVLISQLTGQPTQIVEAMPTAARCLEVAATVSAALSNTNVMVMSQCQMLAKPKSEEG